MDKLGIYFGPQFINIVEIKDRVAVNNIQIPQSAILSGELLEQKVPEELKIVTVLREGLAKNNIETRDAKLVISGKDFIIRTFEMPILSAKELVTALNFEVKKYIPFRVEELVSDFQWVIDKSSKRTNVLFMGIKKQILDRYLSISDKAGLKIKSIEYSGFSILRLLKLGRLKADGIVVVAAVDLLKNDEVNFIILKNGFPLFSRDILAIEGTQDDKTEESRFYTISDKLKREMVISLDYYERKFAAKHPDKIFFITNPPRKINLEMFKDLNVETEFIDIEKYIHTTTELSLPFIKACTAALWEVDSGIKINLLSVKERLAKPMGARELKPSFLAFPFMSYLKIAVASLAICIMVYLLTEHQKAPFKKELVTLRNMRPEVLTVNSDADETELTDFSSRYKEKINTWENFAVRQLYLTELLDSIARLVPQGLWLKNLSFKDKKEDNKTELILEGMSYLGDSNKEVELVNNFLSELKNNPLLAKYFSDMNVVSLEGGQSPEENETHFVISCRNFETQN